METVEVSAEFWKNKKVFVTGHTGFKGGWLVLWLRELGADVYGFSLLPSATPNLFNIASIESALAGSTYHDIRDLAVLTQALKEFEPDIVFHLAAQSLVRESYNLPVETYAINVMGTVNLLEAVRATPSVKAVVNVTTDKCYENKERLLPYREDEPMGGFDPYSSSKACSELVTSAYRSSFFKEHGVALASARAGNVIGGGDWAVDRLIPDFLRAINSGQPVNIRSPNAVRPWQHVLEPLSGYIALAEKLFNEGQSYSEAWNFGPAERDAHPVSWVINHLIKAIPNASFVIDEGEYPYEANYLTLDSSKAKALLGWQGKWSLDTALNKVVEWNEQWCQNKNMKDCCIEQIYSYCNGVNSL